MLSCLSNAKSADWNLTDEVDSLAAPVAQLLLPLPGTLGHSWRGSRSVQRIEVARGKWQVIPPRVIVKGPSCCVFYLLAQNSCNKITASIIKRETQIIHWYMKMYNAAILFDLNQPFSNLPLYLKFSIFNVFKCYYVLWLNGWLFANAAILFVLN